MSSNQYIYSKYPTLGLDQLCIYWHTKEQGNRTIKNLMLMVIIYCRIPTKIYISNWFHRTGNLINNVEIFIEKMENPETIDKTLNVNRKFYNSETSSGGDCTNDSKISRIE